MASVEAPCAESVFDSCPLGVAVLDDQGRIRSVNRALEGFSGLSAPELVGQDRNSLPSDCLGYLFDPVDTVQVRCGGKASNDRWLQCWSRSLDGDQGPAMQVHYYLDITELVGLREERDSLMRQVSDLRPVDPVTGVMGRRALLHMLEVQVARSRRYHTPFSVVLLSMEVPLSVVGESPLPCEAGIRVLTGLLKDQMRWADQVGRLDRHRFLMILPETRSQDTLTLVDKLRRGLHGLTLLDQQGRDMGFFPRFSATEWVSGDDSRLLFQRVVDGLANASLPGS